MRTITKLALVLAAEEAASFSVSIFPDSKVVTVMKAMMQMRKIDIAGRLAGIARTKISSR